MLVLAVLTICMCSGCAVIGQKEELPEDTLERFEEAMNEMDVDGMMECMDEKAVKAVTAGMNAAMGLMKTVTGIDLGISGSDLLDMMPLLQSFALESGTELDMPQVDFEVLETRIRDDKATIFFRDTVSGESTFLNMKKKDGTWYITMDLTPIAEDKADRILYPGEEEDKAEQESDILSEISVKDLLEQLQDGNLLRKLITALLGETAS